MAKKKPNGQQSSTSTPSSQSPSVISHEVLKTEFKNLKEGIGSKIDSHIQTVWWIIGVGVTLCTLILGVTLYRSWVIGVTVAELKGSVDQQLKTVEKSQEKLDKSIESITIKSDDFTKTVDATQKAIAKSVKERIADDANFKEAVEKLVMSKESLTSIESETENLKEVTEKLSSDVTDLRKSADEISDIVAAQQTRADSMFFLAMQSARPEIIENERLRFRFADVLSALRDKSIAARFDVVRMKSLEIYWGGSALPVSIDPVRNDNINGFDIIVAGSDDAQAKFVERVESDNPPIFIVGFTIN